MPPRRSRSSTVSTTTAPEVPLRRPRPQRRKSVVDRNIAALRNFNIDSDVSVEPGSSPTVNSYPTRSLNVAESEASETGLPPLRYRARERPARGKSAGGGGGGGGNETARVATDKGSPWTADDLERLYRTVKMTRRDLGWTTVGDRVGDRSAGECTAKWREMEGRIIEFIRSMGEAGNAGDAD